MLQQWSSVQLMIIPPNKYFSYTFGKTTCLNCHDFWLPYITICHHVPSRRWCGAQNLEHLYAYLSKQKLLSKSSGCQLYRDAWLDLKITKQLLTWFWLDFIFLPYRLTPFQITNEVLLKKKEKMTLNYTTNSF